ncbi:MAG: hypothetical protein ABS81_05370 [Pseudonocardia sp. SCN 72-86]|nr:MAG: hypothetical protein ABS81_05370 [Pseudonocardia sp. SCN 72-86]
MITESVDFDATSQDVRDDPFPIYAQMLAAGPVHRSEAMGSVVVVSHAVARKVLTSQDFSARHTVQQLGAGAGADMGLFGRVSSLPTLDAPAHTRLRRLVSTAFTPASVNGSRSLAERVVAAALDRAEERGRLDIVADIAAPLPSQVIAALLGIQQEDWPRFSEWSDALFLAFKGAAATPEELLAAGSGARNLEDYLRAEIHRRPPDRDEDLIDRIRHASDGGDALTEDEIVTTCMILLVGGNETTTGLIANGFSGLVDDSAAYAALRADPELVPAAVEEFLRLWGPVHLIARKALRDVELGGIPVRAGEPVLLVTGAANRDPEIFDEPDRMRFDRGRNDHMAFGRGAHFCLGGPLARLEAQVAFRTILERLPRLELVDDCRPAWIGPLTAFRVDEVSVHV